MPRLLFGHEWFDSISSGSYWEAEYENIINNYSEVLLPGYFFVAFKTLIQSEFDARKPDYALIDHQYREWWVVEFELAHHPLKHVLQPS